MESIAAERATLFAGTAEWGEHRSRYHFAVPHLAAGTVLDLACGTGFGTEILARSGVESVVAADYSPDALKTTRELNVPHTSVIRVDGTRLPFEEASFDSITSFETVEHIADYTTFVTELRRVLKPGGVMVMSTPNANYTRPVNGVPANPYHVYEFTPDEFRELLSPSFSRVELYGQRVSAEYRICPHWEKPDMLPKDAVSRLKTILWKIQARLPASLREQIAMTVSGRPFYPGENDYVFSEAELATGYVQVAVCHP
jgi:ubiquinone/menaquinone biosynthesis C-methylase UbiE